MRRIWRWFKRALAVLVVLVVLLVAGGWVWLRTTLPHDGAEIADPALRAPVEVFRDAQGVPHIFAENEADAAFAIGWLHAEDRMWQMDAARRLSAGRLSELLGSATLGSDRLMRLLRLRERAEEAVAQLSPEARLLLDRYADGVNAWIDRRPGPLPPEFLILRTAPAPWSPADSLGWAYLMALQLAGDFRAEIGTVRLEALLGPDRAAPLLPDDVSPGPYTIGAAPGSAALVESLAAALPPPLGPDRASNAWVVAGDRTDTGAPILASDPHLGLGLPALWYLVRVVLPDRELVGATAPGTPLLLLGQNGHVAWGLTTAVADTQDLFVVTVDPEDPDRYLTAEGSEPFEIWTETIPVAGGPGEDRRFRATRHGPVISDLDPNLAGATLAEGQVAALAVAALAAPNTTGEALYRMNRATGWAEFEAALRDWVAPIQNIVFADRDGTIAMMTPGLVPVRAEGHDGRRPVDGTDPADDWQGFIPFEELPRIVDPPGGTIHNANNPTVGPDYPYVFGRTDEPTYRAQRIGTLLATRPHDLATSEAMLTDTLTLDAREMLPLLDRFAPDTLFEARAIDRLRHWDGRMDRDRPEPLIYMAWLHALTASLLADPLEELFEGYRRALPPLLLRLTAEDEPWCAAVAEMPGACDRVAARAFRQALEMIAERHGREIGTWRWGDEHKAPLSHQVWNRIPLLGDLLWPPLATNGGPFTVDRGDGWASGGALMFPHTHGAGYRAVYDLADPSASRFIIAGGQSGHPLSPHFRDLAEPWRQGRHITLTGTPEALAAAGATRLTIRPAAPAR